MSQSDVTGSGSPRLWFNPKGVFNSAVLLTEHGVVYGKPKADSPEAIQAALASGQGMTAISRDQITYVRANHRNNEVHVRVKVKKNEHKTIQLEMGDAEARAALYDGLRALLGSAWTHEHVVQSPVQGAMKPGIAMVIIIAVTGFMFMGAQSVAAGEEADVSGRRSGVKRLALWLMETLGPTGILIAGGVALALAAVVLVKRIHYPPIFDELKRASA